MANTPIASGNSWAPLIVLISLILAGFSGLAGFTQVQFEQLGKTLTEHKHPDNQERDASMEEKLLTLKYSVQVSTNMLELKDDLSKSETEKELLKMELNHIKEYHIHDGEK